MARLPSAGLTPPAGAISLGTVLGLMGISPNNISLDNTEVTAMGGAEVANAAAANSLCMPYQKEAVASIGKNNTRAPGAEWISSVPGNNWRPARLSEFQRAYNNKPQLSMATAETGSWRQCTLTCTGNNSDAYTGAGTFYFFRVNGGGTNSNYGDWVQASPGTNGRQLILTITGLAAGNNSFNGELQDYEGCGNRSEFTASTTYNAGNWSSPP